MDRNGANRPVAASASLRDTRQSGQAGKRAISRYLAWQISTAAYVSIPLFSFQSKAVENIGGEEP
jgi:hypothetical protein